MDARNGATLFREDIVEHLDQAQQPETFTGDAARGGRRLRPPARGVRGAGGHDRSTRRDGDLPANDIVLDLKENGVSRLSTRHQPEAIHYAPAGGVPGRVPRAGVRIRRRRTRPAADHYTGTFAMNDVRSATPYPPLWSVFPRAPLSGAHGGPVEHPEHRHPEDLVLGIDR